MNPAPRESSTSRRARATSPAPRTDSRLDQQTAELRDASRRMVRELGMLQSTVDEAGLTPSQCHALIELQLGGPLGVTELSERLMLDKSTVSRLGKALVQQKLVRDELDPDDQRRRRLRPTAKGARCLSQIHRRANQRVATALEQLSEEERETVVRGMALYAKALSRARRTEGVTIGPLRRAEDADAAAIIRRVMSEYGAVGCGYSIEDDEVDGMYRAYRRAGAAFFAARENGRILGIGGIAPLAGGDPDVCELRKMYFLPEARGLGLGRAMLERCIQAARELGYSRMYLETLQHMHEARRLYESFGFTRLDAPMGETGHYRCNGWYLRSL